MPEHLRLKRDWVGRKVRLTREVQTKGGTIFPAGSIMLVTRNFGGLHLEAVVACESCRLKSRHVVRGVSERSVMLLPIGEDLGGGDA